MSRTIIAAIALIAGCNVAVGEMSNAALLAYKAQLEAYESCVVGHAKSFAGSPDSTEALVKNAMAKCAAQRQALSDALSVSGVSSSKLAAVLAGIDQKVFHGASQAIVEERAAH